LATNFIAGRPTTTVTVTALTFVTEIAITSTTAITFAGGQCVPRCLQNLPVCV
jgi:acid phosphatase class B